MGTTYQVVIDMSTKGDLGKAAGRAQTSMAAADHAAGKLMRSLQSMGSQAMRPLDMVAGKMIEIGSVAAKVGIAGAFGLATYGVVKYNNELEKTRIQLGALFSAGGAAQGIHSGMDMAGSVMKQMRKDAAALPGEFGDLMGIMTMISTPGLRAGASVDQLRSLAAQAMATGATVGMPLDQVAREFAMLIEGRAGAHNVFGMRAVGLSGERAEEFNKLAPDERLKRIGTELARFAPAIEVYKTSFEGMSTTMLDSAKSLLGKVTEPLFGKVKSSLMFINDWFDGNETFLKTKADAIGSKLAYAFDQGKAALAEWWPAIEAFGQNAYAKLVEVWADLGPTIKSAGESLKAFLKDPGSIDKIITVMKLYAGAKIGGSLLGAGMGIAGDAGNMLGAAKQMGWIGGAAKGAGAAAGAAGEAAVASRGLAVLGSAALRAAPALLWMAAAAAATYAAYDQATKLFEEVSRDAPLNAMAAFDFGARSVRDLGRELTAAEYAAGDFQDVLQNYIKNGDAAAASSAMAGEAMQSVASAGWAAAAALGAVGGAGGGAESWTVAKAQQMGNEAASSALSAMTMNTMGTIQTAMREGTVGKTKGGPKHGGGGGGTTVQKVEIVVTSNQDPSRVARMVLSEIQNLQRHPRISRGVPNYSASRT